MHGEIVTVFCNTKDTEAQRARRIIRNGGTLAAVWHHPNRTATRVSPLLRVLCALVSFVLNLQLLRHGEYMSATELVYICEICQTILQEHHCKAICPNCGRMFDCSDLPLMAANASRADDSATLTIRPGSDMRDWMPKVERDGDDKTTEKPAKDGADLP